MSSNPYVVMSRLDPIALVFVVVSMLCVGTAYADNVGGRVYSDDGVLAVGSGIAIEVAINGTVSGSPDDTDASGDYSHTGLSTDAGDIITVFVDGEAAQGVTVTETDGGHLAGIDIYYDRLIVRHDNSGTLTNADLATGAVADSDVTAIYTMSGNELTVNVGKELYILSGHTFVPGDTVITHDMDIRGTFQPGTNNVQVTGSWESTGTFTQATSTVAFVSTSDETITSATESFYNLTIADTGLVGHWKFDTGSGTSAFDSSGHGNTGTLTNGPVWSSTNVPTVNFSNANSIQFDGMNDYITIPDPSMPTDDFTFSAWVYSRVITTNAVLMSPDSAGNNEIFWGLGSGNTIQLVVNNASAATSNTSLSVNEWHHVAVTREGSAVNFYLEGKRDGTATKAGTLDFGGCAAYIGTDVDAGNCTSSLGNYWDGLIDDVRVYNRALNHGQVGGLGVGNQPDSAVVSVTLADALDVDNNLLINSGTLDVTASNYVITVGGSWENNGGHFKTYAGTVTLDGTGGSNILQSGGQTFYNLTVSGSGTWDISGILLVDNTFAQSAGTVDVTTSDYSVIVADFDQTAGTFTPRSGTLVLTGSSDATINTSSPLNNVNIEALENALIGYWKFDEGQGNIIHDSSGKNSHGLLYNGAYWSSTVNSTISFDNPYSLSFDGANDYARADSFTSNNSLTTGEAISFSAWFNNTSASASNSIVSMHNSGANIFILGTFSSGEIRVFLANGGTTQTCDLGSGYDNGAWHHVVFAMDDASTPEIGELYVNGVNIGSCTLSGVDVNYSTANQLSFGQEWDGGTPSDYFLGYIDDVRIYDKLLSSTEIASLWGGSYTGDNNGNATFTLNTALDVNGNLAIHSGTLDVSGSNYGINLVGHWDNYAGNISFDARAGTVTLDGTGSNNRLRSDGNTFYNLTLSGSGEWELQDTLSIGNTYTQSAGTLEVTTNNHSIFANDWDQTAGTFTPQSGTLTINSASDQTINTSSAVNNFNIESPQEYGLVGYWKFDEGQGTIAKDSSGNNNNGILVNGPSWSTTVNSTISFDNPYSIDFDGTNDYVDVATDSVLDITAAISLSAWFKSDTEASNEKIVSKQNNTDQPYALQFGTSGNTIVFELKEADETVHQINTTTNPSTEVWHHVVGTYDGTIQKIYFNGVEEAATPLSITIGTNSTSFAVGARIASPASLYFDGHIDDVRVYNRSLESYEVTSLWAGSYTGDNNANATITMNTALDVNGNLAIHSGTLDVSGSNYAINLVGHWDNYAGNISFDARAGTVTLDGTGSNNRLRSDGNTFYNLTLSGSGEWELQDTLSIGNTYTQSAGTLEVTTDNHSIYANDWDQTAGTFTPQSGTLTINSASDQTINTSSAVNNFNIESPEEFGLVGYWKFDEGQGTIAKDSSGNNNHGVLAGGPLWSTTVNSTISFDNPYSIDFDGSDDYVDLGAYAGLVSAGGITVSAWVRPDTLDSGANINIIYVEEENADNGQARSIFDLKDSGKIRYGFAAPDSGAASRVTSSSIHMVVNVWHHVVGVADIAGDSASIYVDGVSVPLDSSPSWTNAAIDATAPANVHLGTNTEGASTTFFDGILDDVRVYNRALSTSEIASLWAGSYSGDNNANATFTLNTALDVNGNLAIHSGTLDVSTTDYAITLEGHWDNYAGNISFNAQDGTVTLDGTGSNNRLRSDGNTFYNLTLSGAGEWELQDKIEVDNIYTQSAGTLEVTTDNHSFFAADFDQTAGTFTPQSGTLTLDGTSDATINTSSSLNNVSIESPQEYGLVGYWKFDEGQGTIAKDSSGNNNNGILVNGPLWSTTVNSTISFDNAYSLEFDGTDDYVAMDGTSTYSFDPITTVAAWFKIRGSTCASSPVLFAVHESDTTSDIVLKFTGAACNIDANNTGGTVGSDFDDSQWHSLVVLYDDTANTAESYVDGVSLGTESDGGGFYDMDGDLYSIGQEWDAGPVASQFFIGFVDDVRIYNRALSATEISNLWKGSYSGNNAGGAKFTLNTALDVNGNLSLHSGTLDVGSDQAVTIFGNWSNYAGYDAFGEANGTVTFDGTDQAINGSTTFYNFTKNESTDDTDDDVLTFEAGSTQWIVNTWTLNGRDSDDQINIVSSIPGTQWSVNPAGTRTLDFVDVTDSNNINATVVTCSDNCTEGTNLTNWSFAAATRRRVIVTVMADV